MASTGKMKKISISKNNETNVIIRNNIDPVSKNSLLLERI